MDHPEWTEEAAEADLMELAVRLAGDVPNDTVPQDPDHPVEDLIARTLIFIRDRLAFEDRHNLEGEDNEMKAHIYRVLKLDRLR